MNVNIALLDILAKIITTNHNLKDLYRLEGYSSYERLTK